jgi:hypothetical protein
MARFHSRGERACLPLDTFKVMYSVAVMFLLSGIEQIRLHIMDWMPCLAGGVLLKATPMSG